MTLTLTGIGFPGPFGSLAVDVLLYFVLPDANPLGEVASPFETSP
jgi:hypothetical protein